MNAAPGRDTLFLACTRPALRYGVPMQAWYVNLFGTALVFAVVGRGNPLYWLLFFVFHFPMAALANRNPNFFHELSVWARTHGQTIGGVLHAVGGRGTPSAV